MLLCVGVFSPAAYGANATAAVWAGAGTYTNPSTGQVLGKGGTATLTVTTSNDTKCVSLNPDWTSTKPTQTSNTAKPSWAFTLTVPSTAGTLDTAARRERVTLRPPRAPTREESPPRRPPHPRE